MKKKIIFIIESFIVGGAEKMLIDIVNHLNPNVYDITVCSIYKYSVYPNYERYFNKPFKEHIHYKYIINNHKPFFYRLSSYIINHFPSWFYKIMIGDKYDTVIAFYEGQPTHLIGSANIKGKKIAWLHTLTEYSQKNKTNESLIDEKNIYLAFDQIVAVSQAVLNSFQKTFTIPDTKTIVIYNSVDISAINKKSHEKISLPPSNGYPIFISVGRITQVKGYDRIIRVASSLKKEGFSFSWWILGGGSNHEEENLKAAIQDHNLQNNIILLGHINNPYAFMRHADCYVSASYIEGLSISVLDAMALHLPVIASDIPANREALEQQAEVNKMLFSNDEQFLHLLKETCEKIKNKTPIYQTNLDERFHKQKQLELLYKIL